MKGESSSCCKAQVDEMQASYVILKVGKEVAKS